MLPMGLKLTDFTKVNKLIFTTLPFNIDDEISRDNKNVGKSYSDKNPGDPIYAGATYYQNKKI